MNELFVDTLHLVALVNPKDQWHQKSVEVETATRNIDLVTTEDILTEFLNFYAEHGDFMRMKVAAFCPRNFARRARQSHPAKLRNFSQRARTL